MAPKNQGIMQISPFLQERLIGKDTRKGLIGNIGDAANILSMEQFDPKAPQTGTTRQAIRDILKEPLRFGYNVVSNIPSVFQGISRTLDEQTDEARAKKASDVAQAMSGVEFGLPQDLDARQKGTIFTPEGQEALGAEISKQLQPIFTKETDGDIAEEENLIASDVATEESDENLSNAQKATKGALDEFLKEARPGVSPKEYKDYIEEFGKATGLDISGDPDTKQALMSFGLALMQNRAGKGFDVSKILTSVGEAGEAAMPEFSKAVSEAKAIRAKAGAFAISRKKEDQAAAMNKRNYYIIPRGKTGGIKGLQENFEKGRNILLNSFELNALSENDKFNEQFEIVPDAIYKKAADAYFETPEFGEKYMSKYTPISLFKDAPKDLQIDVANVNPNYKGPDAPKQGFFNVNQYDTFFQRLTRMDNGLNKIEKDLGKAYNIVKSGKVDAPGQIADSISSFAAAFGFQGSPDATDKAKVLYVLDSIAAKKAPQILGEAGKTISDADRERVKAIVGKLETFSDPRTLQLALKEVYELIVVEGKQDIRDGLSTLNKYSGKEKPVFENKYKGLKIGDDGIFNVSDEDD